MKRLFLLSALLLGITLSCGAATPVPLSSVSAVKALTNEQAAQDLPVAFEATVTYYSKSDKDLFLQDNGMAVYGEAPGHLEIVPGDRVFVKGKTRASFSPDLLIDSVTFVRHGAPPAPLPATFPQMIRAELDCMRVTLHATVRSADVVTDLGRKSIYMQLLMDGGYIDATVDSSDASALKGLLDSEIDITGVVSGKFDSKNQLTGILLETAGLSDVKVLKHAKVAPDSLPITPMDQILQGFLVRDLTKRVRVRGTITYYEPGSTIVLQDGAKSVWVTTQYEKPLRVGDRADATGFPDVRDFSLTLTRGEIQDSLTPAPVAPRHVTSEELASGVDAFDFVSVEGTVLVSVREAAQDDYVLVANGHIFSAMYRHPDSNIDAALPAMRQIPPGSKVRINGICMLYYGSDPFQGPVSFDILMRNLDDLSVVADPSLLNVRNLGLLVVLLLVLVLSAGARAWLSESKGRRHTAQLAYVEQQRARILEDINGSRPLAEIIEQITALVSFKLKGAPSWCQIVDGALLGSAPSKPEAMRIVSFDIPSRTGHRLGTLYVALNPATRAERDEMDALSSAGGLATLAIETRRLYSDLLHRSEFDQLTDIHNRFSLQKRLDALIEEARNNATIFGLIYIDLDDFKQINDFYGHHTGDNYLQQVSVRMKSQLRSVDTLARLGGDEFAVLVPVVRNREAVDEIASRLKRCFDTPITIDGRSFKGTASMGVAIYPRDGSTRDSLLNSADALMYAEKNTKSSTA